MISLGARACLLVSPAAPSRVAIPPRRRNGSRLPRLCAPCYSFCKCTQKKRFVRPLHAKNATPPRFYAFPHRLLRASAPCAGIRSAGLYVLRPPTPCPLSRIHHASFSSSRILFSKSPRLPFLPPAFSFPSHHARFPKPPKAFPSPLFEVLAIPLRCHRTPFPIRAAGKVYGKTMQKVTFCGCF